MHKKNLYILILLSTVLFSCKNSTQNNTERVIAKDYVPKNLEEALMKIDFNLTDSLKLKIKKKSENEFLTDTHFGFGLGLRNGWKLWKGSELSKYFNKIGIFHPDDMSSIILTSYYRKVNGIDIKLDEQVNYYKKYWKGAELTRLPENSEHPEPDLEFRASIYYWDGNPKKKHAQVFIQTNSKNKKYWIYDYFYGWKKINQKTKEKLEDTMINETELVLNEIFEK